MCIALNDNAWISSGLVNEYSIAPIGEMVLLRYALYFSRKRFSIKIEGRVGSPREIKLEITAATGFAFLESIERSVSVSISKYESELASIENEFRDKKFN